MSEKDLREEILKNPWWMLELYASGSFPMAPDKESGIVDWFHPEERCVILLDNYNIPRSVNKLLKEKRFEIKFDAGVMEVIKNCSKRESTWISRKLTEAYKRINKLGFLHSVETYQNGELAGGLYGISIGHAFFGESMFSNVSGASKAALASLLIHLRTRGYLLLDVQYMTEHLAMFGAAMISHDDYSILLNKAISDEESLHRFID